MWLTGACTAVVTLEGGVRVALWRRFHYRYIFKNIIL